MDTSTNGRLNEMGMEEPTFINQYEINCLDDLIIPQELAAAFGENFHLSYSSDQIFTSIPNTNPYPCSSSNTTKITSSTLKNTGISWNSCNSNTIWPSPDVSSSRGINMDTLSFANSNSLRTSTQKKFCGSSLGGGVNHNYAASSTSYSKPPCSQDHIIAERKRREKLTQQFTALSALVPNLMKVNKDKASVLEYSTVYLKQLQQRVKTLEEQISNKTTESVVFVKKLQIPCYNEENLDNFPDEPFPRIEVRAADRNVLIKIHCKKQKGVLVKILVETEKLNLSVFSSSVIPFGTSTLDITVMAQMNEEFILTMKDLVNKLFSAYIQYM